MATVPTGRMEAELRRAYLNWVRGVPTDPSKLKAYTAKFMRQVDAIITKHGGDAARVAAKAGFPSARHTEVDVPMSKYADEFTTAIVQAGKYLGQNAGTIASALGVAKTSDVAFGKLLRTARTEVVGSYWAQQFSESERLDLVLVWSSEESPRTCYQCLARDGLVVKNKNVRDHPNGRCTLRAVFPEDVPLRGKGANPRFDRVAWDGRTDHLFDAPGMQDYRRLLGGSTARNLVADVTVQQGVAAMVSQGWTSAQAALLLRQTMAAKRVPLPSLDAKQYSTVLRLYERMAQDVWEGLKPGTDTVKMYRGGEPRLATGLYSWSMVKRVAEGYAVRNALKGGRKVVKEMTVPKAVLRYDLTEANPQQREFMLLGEPRVLKASASSGYTVERGLLDAPTEYLPFSKEVLP